MKILISGATGFVGSALTADLRRAGHTVNALVRPGKPGAPGDVGWDPQSGKVETAGIEGVDAIVHLAGASIASGRWTESRKKLLRTSRVDATRHLMNALEKLSRPPKVFVAASAVGYYGSRGDELLTEVSAAGSDFLAELARDWEAESQRAEKIGARTVCLRFGVILAAHGGALPQMMLPFKMGVGGKIGSGLQWMSWISLPDVSALARHALENSEMNSAVNAVAPSPVRNEEFTKILGKVLRRPTLFPAPTFALRLALGEMADALLLASQRAVPARMQERNYQFRHEELEPALRAVLQK